MPPKFGRCCCVTGFDEQRGYGRTISDQKLSLNQGRNSGIAGSVAREVHPSPDHLVVLVNGIIGSAQDWTFTAKEFCTKLNNHVSIHCSQCNSARKTFHGIDVMGHRLSTEVQRVINDTPGLTKISFLAHSLGGLVARYAISQLYKPFHQVPLLDVGDSECCSQNNIRQLRGTVGGLEPINFITLATPHLGSRGKEQLPLLFGIQLFEKAAPLCAPWFIGQTGRHLFLTDASTCEPPLLRRMATDCDEGKFLSSLLAFKKRVVYANVVNDYMVGWQTASIRRKSELPQIKHEPLDSRYPHIVREEDSVVGPVESPATVCIKSHSSDKSNASGQHEYQEQILVGLTQLPWQRVDVSFYGSKAGSAAHNVIQVKNSKMHYEGADVIKHIIDKHFQTI